MPDGNAENLQGQAEAAAYVSAMLMRGTQKHDRESLARELDKLRSQIRVSGGGQRVTVTMAIKAPRQLSAICQSNMNRTAIAVRAPLPPLQAGSVAGFLPHRRCD